MFERRIKFLLVFLLALLSVIIFRVFQVQVVQHADWTEKARVSLRKQQAVDTVRGGIFDVQGRQIALDVACIDACVDYRVIQEPPDEKWVKQQAQARLRGRMEGSSKAERAEKLKEEIAAVHTEIDQMWDTLARLPGSSPQQVADTRRAITARVEFRRRIVWYSAYEQAMKKHETAEKPAWYRSWLSGSDADAPKLETFETEVSDQYEAHPILRNISSEVNNFLAKNQEHLPGLTLRPGITRSYPFGEAGAHLLGHLTRVTREDLDSDNEESELRQYFPSDLIGRTGLEGLFEPRLRGTRGKRFRVGGQEQESEFIEPLKGQDVRTTIDIALQGKIQDLFAHARFKPNSDVDKYEKTPMHGAAVVIDVASGEVRALASYPAYDPNTLDAEYRQLLDDEINMPLMNRATMDMLEPGSTVKPLVGLSAITAGKLGVNEAITCHGYLVLNGKQYKVGRCWTMTMFQSDHRYFPDKDKHPTGDLVYPDAIQRSCNVFFETCGDRLGIDGLTTWMGKFGLGRPTGIGVAEASGRLPGQTPTPAFLQKSTSWFAGIGQGKVAATPIQMANVAATIARNGIWTRPRLIPTGDPLPKQLAADGIPDRVDLELNPQAVKLAQEGMTRVVNTLAGSGQAMKRDDIVVAGKTGTAQAAPFTYRKHDANGQIVKDAAGNAIREHLQLSTAANPNPAAPWYRGTGHSGTDLAHAWFIGFAPAEKPQIAFCVLVEYGGGGGTSAAPIAKDILQACIDAGYLQGTHSNDQSQGVGILEH